MPLSNAVNSVMSTLRDSFKLFGSPAKDDTTKAPKITGTNFDWGGNAIKDELLAEKEGAMRSQREEGATFAWRNDTIMDSDGPTLVGGGDVWEDFDADEMPALTDGPRDDFEMIDRYNDANELLRSNGMRPLGGPEIDYDNLQTIDLTNYETPVTPPVLPSSPPQLRVRTVYGNYEDDDTETMIDIDEAAEAARCVATSALGIRQERTSSGSIPVITIDGDSDSDISIVQPKRRIARSRMTTPMTSPTDDTTTQIKADTSHLPLAERLRYEDEDGNTEITFPQVIGKGAYDDPSLLDDYIATPVLRDLIANSGYPAEVLWACFLKNNTWYLDTSSACDIMRLWLDQKPKHWKNIERLVFDDFLNHPRVCQTVAHPRVWSTYRPIKLMAKCSNLQYVELRLSVDRLPGFKIGWGWNPKVDFDTEKFVEVLEERVRIQDLITKTPKSLRQIMMSLYVGKQDWKPLERYMEKLKGRIIKAFVEIARASGRSKEEREGIDFDVQFVPWGSVAKED